MRRTYQKHRRSWWQDPTGPVIDAGNLRASGATDGPTEATDESGRPGTHPRRLTNRANLGVIYRQRPLPGQFRQDRPHRREPHRADRARRLGRHMRRPHHGLRRPQWGSAGKAAGSCASKAASARCPDRNSASKAGWSTRSPRPVFTRNPPGRIIESAHASTIPRVAPLDRACRVTTSASESSSGRGTSCTANPSGTTGFGSQARTVMPNPKPIRATRRPIWPNKRACAVLAWSV